MGGNDDDVEIFAWGARGELHVPDTISVPLTLFVDYDGADYQHDGDNDQLIEHTFLFGISLHFGGDRAQDDAKRFDCRSTTAGSDRQAARSNSRLNAETRSA